MIFNLNFHRHNIAINYHEGRAETLANKAQKHLVKREKHVEWMAAHEKYARVRQDLLEQDLEEYKDLVSKYGTGQKPKAERAKNNSRAKAVSGQPATA